MAARKNNRGTKKNAPAPSRPEVNTAGHGASDDVDNGRRGGVQARARLTDPTAEPDADSPVKKPPQGSLEWAGDRGIERVLGLIDERRLARFGMVREDFREMVARLFEHAERDPRCARWLQQFITARSPATGSTSATSRTD